MIEKSEGVSQVFHAAQKHSGNPVVQRDRPWEGVAAITGPYVEIVEFNGFKANNLVVSANQPEVTGGGHCHNPSVIIRPEEQDTQKR